MLRTFQLALIGLLLGVGAPAGRAFSLLGPFEAYQTLLLTYQGQAEIGGPLNLGEEYRINTRVLTYGFDESFLNYFGSAGTAAVHSAFAILNALPPVSAMSPNLTEFATDTTRINFQASALGMLDLKSYTLGFLVEQMGLTSPERFAWTLRDRRIFTVAGDTFTNYLVIQRNFDPVTWSPTPYVNGVLYTYQVQEFTAPTQADAVETTVDPLAVGFTAVASLAEGIFGGTLGAGGFYTGLTRDDVGGLRYLIRTNNYNIELLPNGSVTTPTFTTNFPGPFEPAGTPPTITTNTITNQTLRAGVDKITFVPYQYDSILGVPELVTNVYTDTFVTNSILYTQAVTRVTLQPDILISAEDLGVVLGVPLLVRRTGVGAWQNNNAINGQANLAGPGVIQPGGTSPTITPITITFSKLGPYFFNQNPFFIDELSASPGTIWGSFDGTTNPPVVFPLGTLIQDIERQVLSP
ncbi:MAG: hypothetical protein HY301_14820 [Verrucomicrobia bacterium]|nr:hypothetical protein [Verrucomicrobiota bacterium]